MGSPTDSSDCSAPLSASVSVGAVGLSEKWHASAFYGVHAAPPWLERAPQVVLGSWMPHTEAAAIVDRWTRRYREENPAAGMNSLHFGIHLEFPVAKPVSAGGAVEGDYVVTQVTVGTQHRNVDRVFWLVGKVTSAVGGRVVAFENAHGADAACPKRAMLVPASQFDSEVVDRLLREDVKRHLMFGGEYSTVQHALAVMRAGMRRGAPYCADDSSFESLLAKYRDIPLREVLCA